MIYIREEGGEIRQGLNFYPRSDEGSAGCQILFGPLRAEFRWSKRRKRFRVRVWFRERPELPKEEFVYIPGYTEFLEKCARRCFGNHPWEGVEPKDKFTPDAQCRRLGMDLDEELGIAVVDGEFSEVDEEQTDGEA